jgi:hypothetical protein
VRTGTAFLFGFYRARGTRRVGASVTIHRTAFAAIPPLLLLPVLRSDIERRGIEDANTSKLCSSLFGRSLASRSYLAMTPGVLLYI